MRLKLLHLASFHYLTEEDAKAEGGYSLTEFRAFWKESHTVWNPKLKVFVVTFQVDKVVKGGKVK